MLAGIAALSLILLIMMFITRSLVAALVIVGTVALSLGASFGLSVLLWQDILGIQLYWVVLALAIILLLAVGSDYNLLLISRFKEEIGGGLNTGIIRAMAGTGGVVTAAGLVFAFTMSSFVFSDLRVLGQIGTTIGLGLLFDTLIVRSFMTPSIATLLGRPHPDTDLVTGLLAGLALGLLGDRLHHRMVVLDRNLTRASGQIGLIQTGILHARAHDRD